MWTDTTLTTDRDLLEMAWESEMLCPVCEGALIATVRDGMRCCLACAETWDAMTDEADA